jgi:hypothetical protein
VRFWKTFAVTGADCIEVRAGPSRGLALAHLLLTLLGAAGILASGTRPGWAALTVLILVFASGAGYRHMQNSPVGRLRLYTDGSATLLAADGGAPAVQRPGAWVCRWLCIVPLVSVETGEALRCLVCRSLNRPSSYRCLLAWLRLRSVGDETRPVSW